jgi:hypothetical protein
MSDTTFGLVPAHDAALLSAEQQRQSATAATLLAYGPEQGAQIVSDLTTRQHAQDVAYFRAIAKSAIANGVSPSAALSALRELTGAGL